MSPENLPIVDSFYLKSKLLEVGINGPFAISVGAVVFLTALALILLFGPRRWFR